MEDKYTVLQKYFGYTGFRDGQEQLIDGILGGRDVLGIMPTGSGKSICYQVPAILMEGITLVISPLISLMKDQVSALIRAGVPAAFINSSLTPAQIRTAYKRCRQGLYKIIYVAPERLQTYDFLGAIQGLKIAMVAVDEAHCISQWGQDFRPSYVKIVEFLESLPERPVVSAFTATATQAVARDIRDTLALSDPIQLTTGFDRPNLRFEVRKPREKSAELLQILEERKGKSGIIYCATRKETEAVWELLRDRGYPAAKYHAGLSEEERRENQDAFIYDRCPIMAATNAFGMGIDKSNVSFVIHYNMPKCIEAYYQEAGRAGRDGTPADCILMYASKDVQTAKFLIQTPAENSELTPEQQDLIMDQDFKRLDQMIGYCSTTGCLRGYILRYFGQEHPETCGNCSSCTGEFVTRDVTGEAETILLCLKEIRNWLGYCLGENLVLKVLRGSRTKRILEAKLDQLSTYGKLSGLTEDRLQEIFSAMKEKGLLKTNYRYGTLEAWGSLDPETDRVELRVREEERPQTLPAALKQNQADSELLVRLKALRLALAREEGVPAYIVFSNATLQDMAQRMPKTMEEFLQVSGVGSCKAQRYGEKFLEEICRQP